MEKETLVQTIKYIATLIALIGIIVTPMSWYVANAITFEKMERVSADIRQMERTDLLIAAMSAKCDMNTENMTAAVIRVERAVDRVIIKLDTKEDKK